MKNVFGAKFIKLLHFVRVFFKRAFILVAVLLFGTAMISFYSLKNMVEGMANIYKGNPSGITTVFAVLLIIPLLSYALEKKLVSYLNHK